MDYIFSLYPSNDEDMQNLLSKKKALKMKVLCNKPIAEVYKTVFSSVVKSFNETALRGRIIENYYKAICDSNIPPVYCLFLSVRYDVVSKSETETVDNAVAGIYKRLNNEKNVALTTVVTFMRDMTREFYAYFVPIAEGYSTGLTKRADIIDAVLPKEENDGKVNIIKAMPIISNYYESMWREISGGAILSQSEAEELILGQKPEDPQITHAVEMRQLKESINKLQMLNEEGNNLQKSVQSEIARIKNDFEWSRSAEAKILAAEDERKAAEKRKLDEEHRRKSEQGRTFTSDQSKPVKPVTVERKDSSPVLTAEEFRQLVAEHFKWMKKYNISLNTDMSSLSDSILSDPGRLVLRNVRVESVAFKKPFALLGAELFNCVFYNCDFAIEIYKCNIRNIAFKNTGFRSLKIRNSSIQGITSENNRFENIDISDSVVFDSIFNGSCFENVLSAPNSGYVNVSFANTRHTNCDMKKNSFTRVNFSNAEFTQCDLRSSAYIGCSFKGVVKNNALM